MSRSRKEFTNSFCLTQVYNEEGVILDFRFVILDLRNYLIIRFYGKTYWRKYSQELPLIKESEALHKVDNNE